MIRLARTALLAPLVVVGGFLTLTMGSVNVLAAGSSAAMTAPVPQSSSKPQGPPFSYWESNSAGSLSKGGLELTHIR